MPEKSTSIDFSMPKMSIYSDFMMPILSDFSIFAPKTIEDVENEQVLRPKDRQSFEGLEELN